MTVRDLIAALESAQDKKKPVYFLKDGVQYLVSAFREDEEDFVIKSL